MPRDQNTLEEMSIDPLDHPQVMISKYNQALPLIDPRDKNSKDVIPLNSLNASSPPQDKVAKADISSIGVDKIDVPWDEVSFNSIDPNVDNF